MGWSLCAQNAHVLNLLTIPGSIKMLISGLAWFYLHSTNEEMIKHVTFLFTYISIFWLFLCHFYIISMCMSISFFSKQGIFQPHLLKYKPLIYA